MQPHHIHKIKNKNKNKNKEGKEFCLNVTLIWIWFCCCIICIFCALHGLFCVWICLHLNYIFWFLQGSEGKIYIYNCPLISLEVDDSSKQTTPQKSRIKVTENKRGRQYWAYSNPNADAMAVTGFFLNFFF